MRMLANVPGVCIPEQGCWLLVDGCMLVLEAAELVSAALLLLLLLVTDEDRLVADEMVVTELTVEE